MNRPNIEPKSGDSSPLLIDAMAAAKACGISRRLLWTLTDSGAIPCRRIGRRVLYSPSELQAWIDSGCPTKRSSGRK